MISSEALSSNERQLADLRKIISRGEGLHLEFKRKVAHPEKVIRELIAFANTGGGTLLVGVDDDGGLAGVKYPEEELLSIQRALQQYCRPIITLEHTIVPITAKKFIVRLDVEVNTKRPHYFVSGPLTKESFVRADDMSVKASREMLEIVRRSKKNKGTRFTFGDAEKKLMEYLENSTSISLDEFKAMANLNRYMAAKKLILLVLANVIRITPTEKGDLYSRSR